jgi:hypothetical protein
MDLESLRRGRRILSAAVSLAAIALVMAKVGGAGTGAADAVGSIASLAFVISLVLLVVVWRKEHIASEAAFAARAEQQLAFMKLEHERAKNARADGPEPQARFAAGKKAATAQRTPRR